MEAAAGIPLMSILSDYTRHIQRIFNLSLPNFELSTLFNIWINSDIKQMPPSWKNFLLIIRLLNLNELALRMETYLLSEELSPTIGKLGERNVLV